MGETARGCVFTIWCVGVLRLESLRACVCAWVVIFCPGVRRTQQAEKESQHGDHQGREKVRTVNCADDSIEEEDWRTWEKGENVGSWEKGGSGREHTACRNQLAIGRWYCRITKGVKKSFLILWIGGEGRVWRCMLLTNYIFLQETGFRIVYWSSCKKQRSTRRRNYSIGLQALWKR